MPITLVGGDTAVSGDGNSVTCPTQNLIGADLVLMGSGSSDPATVVPSDTSSNVLTSLPATNNAGVRAQIHYKASPIVDGTDAGIITATGGFPGVTYAGFSGVLVSNPIDKQNGGSSTGANSVSTGTVSPDSDGQLLFATCAGDSGDDGPLTVTDGWALIGIAFTEAGNSWIQVGAYKIQTTATTEGCTFTASSGTPVSLVSRIVSIRPAEAGGGGGSGSGLAWVRAGIVLALPALPLALQHSLRLARQRERAIAHRILRKAA